MNKLSKKLPLVFNAIFFVTSIDSFLSFFIVFHYSIHLFWVQKFQARTRYGFRWNHLMPWEGLFGFLQINLYGFLLFKTTLSFDRNHHEKKVLERIKSFFRELKSENNPSSQGSPLDLDLGIRHKPFSRRNRSKNWSIC